MRREEHFQLLLESAPQNDAEARKKLSEVKPSSAVLIEEIEDPIIFVYLLLLVAVGLVKVSLGNPIRYHELLEILFVYTIL